MKKILTIILLGLIVTGCGNEKISIIEETSNIRDRAVSHIIIEENN